MNVEIPKPYRFLGCTSYLLEPGMSDEIKEPRMVYFARAIRPQLFDGDKCAAKATSFVSEEDALKMLIEFLKKESTNVLPKTT